MHGVHVLWLIPIILGSQEAEVRRMAIQGQFRHTISKIPSEPVRQVKCCVCDPTRLKIGEFRSEARPGQKHKTLAEK
jgi:hypothetical protein